ncbi:MAG: hypothetical protein J3Q66DRAFT_425243 [Benniella sp.]|nr:MAG: hypothetical protein J3Q66DRAFT_425243 [Benniella sp.]
MTNKGCSRDKWNKTGSELVDSWTGLQKAGAQKKVDDTISTPQQRVIFKIARDIIVRDEKLTREESKDLNPAMISQESTPKSEQEVVNVWKNALTTLSDGQLSITSGEKICRATRIAQRDLQQRFGITSETDKGRKVDPVMDVDGLEVLNTEAKFDEGGTVCEVQYKKNLRINHANYREARRTAVELPVMMPLDIRGMLAENKRIPR